MRKLLPLLSLGLLVIGCSKSVDKNKVRLSGEWQAEITYQKDIEDIPAGKTLIHKGETKAFQVEFTKNGTGTILDDGVECALTYSGGEEDFQLLHDPGEGTLLIKEAFMYASISSFSSKRFTLKGSNAIMVFTKN